MGQSSNSVIHTGQDNKRAGKGTEEHSFLDVLRYYRTMLLAALLLLTVGFAVIPFCYVLRKLFGYKGIIYPVAQACCRLFVRSSGARVHITGLENLAPDKTYLFAANHQSNIDPPILFAYLNRDMGAIAKKELLKVPLFKMGFELVHIVPIDRRNRQAAIESTRRGAQELMNGHSIIAFPEGTRSKDGSVDQFKKGVFHMAIEANVIIAPVALHDTMMVMKKGVKAAKRADVICEILEPVDPKQFNGDADKLAEHLQQMIASRLN